MKSGYVILADGGIAWEPDIIIYHCRTCGFSTDSPQEAFQHRSVGDMALQHHIVPLTKLEAERMFSIQEFEGVSRETSQSAIRQD